MIATDLFWLMTRMLDQFGTHGHHLKRADSKPRSTER
jgi:hypothetical protein